MKSSQFGRLTSATASTLKYYFEEKGPTMVIRETIRFIDDNFRLQGWQGASFQPWASTKRGGNILIKTGQLRHGFNYDNRGKGEVYFYNNVPYAKVHNEGFFGMVTVPAYTKTKYLKIKADKMRKLKASTRKIGEKKIEEYTRHGNIVQRQFAPTESSPSPVLVAEITKWLERDIKNILEF